MDDAIWYTAGDAARALGVSDRTIANWAKAGVLPYFVTPGGHRRFRAADVHALLEERMHGATR